MEYLEQLYQWISSKDDTFTNRYTIDDFKTNMNDADYATKMYNWISSKDDNFTNKYTVDAFVEKVKKKDDSDLPLISQEEDTDSITVTGEEDVSSVSGQTPRELSYIEQEFQRDVPDAERNYVVNRGGVFPSTYKTEQQGGNVTFNQELITALNNDPGIIDALQKGKVTVVDIQNASSNKKELREKAIKKLQEYRVKSEDEIEEIIKNERLDTPFIYETASQEDGF